jgi:hypothetical protein
MILYLVIGVPGVAEAPNGSGIELAGTAFHAAQRAVELIAASDIEGQRTWLRILARIEELERMEPREGRLVQ